jgi:hypothetical protein
MPTEVEVLKNGRVLLYRYSDPLDLEAWRVLMAEMRPLYDQATSPIHMICELSGLTKIPPNFINFVIFGSTNLRHPKLGHIVAIIPHSGIMQVVKLLISLMPHLRWHSVDTLDSAFDFVDRLMAAEKVEVP